ncbi:hypothetical protein [Lacinutrix sp. Hel_I_90]|nr:hypothetical protein [Lacinutrix sp. Hel_I_90]
MNISHQSFSQGDAANKKAFVYIIAQGHEIKANTFYHRRMIYILQ